MKETSSIVSRWLSVVSVGDGVLRRLQGEGHMEATTHVKFRLAEGKERCRFQRSATGGGRMRKCR